MPTIPLYDPTARPGQWRRVLAPGGYEWWCFEARSSAGDVCVRLDLFDGNPFSEEYRSAYARYRRRPTRVSPPVPRDYPAARLAILNKPSSVETIQAPTTPGTFDATPQRVRVGPAVMSRDDPGSIRVGWDGILDLMFRSAPGNTPEMHELESDEPTSAHYRTVMGTSLEVNGTLRGSEFAGSGRHDHFFGTGPIAARMLAARDGFSAGY
jgi:hypothetical protein